MRLFDRLLWLLALCVIVLVGCADRGPAEIEADAERSIAKLKPLIREVDQIEKRLDAQESQCKADRVAIKSVRDKLTQLGHTPTPAPAPPPPPPPDHKPPPPPPDPPSPKPAVLPAGEFSISNDVKTWVETLVPPEGRATGIAHFIRAAKAIADDCDSGKITGWNRIALVGSIKEAIGQQNATIPPDVLVNWKQFAAAFNKRANELFTAGRLTTPAHWATLLREVVIGLEAVKSP